MWLPPVIIDEMNDIKREDDLMKNVEAFNKMVKYCRIGREMKRLNRFDFSRSVSRIPVDDFNKNKLIDIPKPPKGKKKYKKNPNVSIFGGRL